MNDDRLLGLLVALIVICSIIGAVFKNYLLWIGIAAGILIILLIYVLVRDKTFRENSIGLWGKFINWLTQKPKTSRAIYNEPRKTIPGYIIEEVYQRAKYRCQLYNCSQTSNLEIHHIDKNRGNNNMTNLILLCGIHHKEADNNFHRQRILKRWASGNY
jgi:hypothetical protein